MTPELPTAGAYFLSHLSPQTVFQCEPAIFLVLNSMTLQISFHFILGNMCIYYSTYIIMVPNHNAKSMEM